MRFFNLYKHKKVKIRLFNFVISSFCGYYYYYIIILRVHLFGLTVC